MTFLAMFLNSSLRIGARKSILSRLQARSVGLEITKHFPQLKIEYIFTSSFGDQNRDIPLHKFSEKGVFTEDLRLGLKKRRFDLLVHSWKDLPVDLSNESLIYTLSREDQRDLFLFKKSSWDDVKKKQSLRVLTSSPRRAYQIREFLSEGFFPLPLRKIEITPIRGNIPTRLEKLIHSKQEHALILAKAALDRLLSPFKKNVLKDISKKEKDDFLKTQSEIKHSLNQCQWMILPLKLFPSSAAQGALAIECLKERKDLLDEILRPLHKDDVFKTVTKERNILKMLGGGCHQNIGVSILKRPYGLVQYYRGDFTPAQVLLSSEEKEGFQWEKTDKKKIFPFHTSEARFFERIEIKKKLKSPPSNSLLWVSRYNAFPHLWKNKNYTIWTAGIKTWKKLSSRGLWIHGCSEGLGEEEEEKIEQLLNVKKASWIKLTHSEGISLRDKEAQGHKKKIELRTYTTYKLKALKSLPDLKNKTHFYWKSGSQFLLALKVSPYIREGFHASGPGHTYKVIQKHIPKERRKVFLSHLSWKRYVMKHHTG